MTSKEKTIAILGGTGDLGPALALRWSHAGHRVIIGSRQVEKALGVASELNAELGNGDIEGMHNANAARAAEICVLTVEQQAHQAALESVKDAVQGKILVDTTARLSFPDLTPPASPSAARIAQDLLGGNVRVAAAFQTVPAASLRKNIDQPLDSDVLVCCDDESVVEVVLKLVRDAGLQGFYAGSLDKAIVLEGLTSLMVTMNKYYKSLHGTIRVAGINKPQ